MQTMSEWFHGPTMHAKQLIFETAQYIETIKWYATALHALAVNFTCNKQR